MPMAIAEVNWEVARDPRFQNLAGRGIALARPELGHSVHVEVEGLEPGREYWYRFRAGDETSQVGRTRTAPPAGAAVNHLRFAVCGCSHYEAGYFTAYRRIADEQFDCNFHTGDYIYEGRADGGRSERIRQHNSDEIYTLVDYRNRYARGHARRQRARQVSQQSPRLHRLHGDGPNGCGPSSASSIASPSPTRPSAAAAPSSSRPGARAVIPHRRTSDFELQPSN
jgi:phosphodiesterase/alkaline phosphatase D-like protein